MVNIIRSGSDVLFPLALVILTFMSACAQTPVQETRVAVDEPPPLRPVQDAATSPAEGPVTLRPGHPQTYIVGTGDTLMDVAEQFLEDPWRWSDVWQPDPELDDPDRIYPGEIVELYYQDGKPRLRLLQPDEQITIKLSPKVRVAPLRQPIPTVPRQAIASFLEESLVLNEADWERAPYIVGSIDDRVLLTTGDRIYVRGVQDSDQRYYQVFRPAEEYTDPQTGRSLGFGGVYVGAALLQEEGDPATLLLTTARKEIREGDRLFPRRDTVDLYTFTPHPAPSDTYGRVIEFLNEAVMANQYQSVVIDLGEWQGMEPGHILKVFSAGEEVTDPITGSELEVSGEQAGLVMVYKVHDWVSYALIMEMTLPIRIGDRVREP